MPDSIDLGTLTFTIPYYLDLSGNTESINQDYINFYEFTIKREDLTDRRKMAYKNSLRTFMLSTSDENLRNDPYLYEGLQEE